MCIICSLLVANISYYWYYMRGMIATTYCLFPGPKVLLYYGCIKIHCCIYANLIPYQLVFLGDGLGWCGNSKCKSYIIVYFVCHHFYLFYFFPRVDPLQAPSLTAPHCGWLRIWLIRSAEYTDADRVK